MASNSDSGEGTGSLVAGGALWESAGTGRTGPREDELGPLRPAVSVGEPGVVDGVQFEHLGKGPSQLLVPSADVPVHLPSLRPCAMKD